MLKAKELKMPEVWTASKKPVIASTKVTARIDMSAEVAGKGLCPDCREPMEDSHTSGIPVIACHPCRIVLPKPDTEEYKLEIAKKKEESKEGTE
jgi:hypothetical protein